MADALRVVETSALDRLASAIAVQNGLSPDEGREEARHAMRFFSALLDPEISDDATTAKNRRHRKADLH